MKTPVKHVSEWMLIASVLGLAVIGGSLIWSATQPAPIKFVSLEVTNTPRSGDMLYVNATVERREEDGCTNGVQVEAMDPQGVMVRLPVPTRLVRQDFSRYAIVIPDATMPGPYRLKVRETSYCGSGPKIAETPWIAFEVGK